MTDAEINEAVARKLGIDLGNLKPREYCHSIEAAFEILHKFKSWTIGKHWEGGFVCLLMDGSKPIKAEADTAPMAICLAFLKLEDR